MNESFSAFVRVLTAVLWGPHVLLLILLAGVWFTLRGRFMQVTKLPGMTRGALCGTQRCGGFSAFQSLTASLAGSLGTGNILGVAAAILVGGAGAVVWMWIAAFFGMMTVYAEGVLAAKFGTKNAPGRGLFSQLVQKGLCPFWTEGLQSAARIICSLKANKFHTCRLRSIFAQVHAPGENDPT